MTQEDLNQIRAVVREELVPVCRRMDVLERTMDRVAGTSAALEASVAALHRWANRIDEEIAAILKREAENLKKEALARNPQIHESPEDLARRWCGLPNKPPN
jgi:hypothetical protein